MERIWKKKERKEKKGKLLAELLKDSKCNKLYYVFCFHSPLLLPSGPRRMVHSSIVPKAVNNCLTSSSVCCLLSIPTNSFLSAGRPRVDNRGNREKKKKKESVNTWSHDR